MAKNLKRKLLISCACVLMAAATAFAVGCRREAGVEKINITKSNSPQVVYVLGSDLDLSEGILTVVSGKNRTEVPLNDPKVTVTGYDKSVLGEQVLTITYGGKTTTLKISVVPRLAAEGYEDAYFVGESFNPEKGHLVLTNDDGESSVVGMNNDAVSISGFDSSVASEAMPITATYLANGETYTATFNVGVYEVESFDFNAPTKKFYQNHEKALDVAGGYFSVSCAKTSRYVLLTEDMVSGFDLSAATIDNRDNPYVQTLTVTFLGKTATYDIQIHFSDLSLMLLRNKEMASLYWTSNDLPAGCTEEMGENALTAMKVYMKMTDAEKTTIPEGTMDPIVKVASVYGLEKWQTAFATYKDAFYLTEQNTLSWDCSNFEKTKIAYTKILNKDPILYSDAATLTQMATEFAELVVSGEDTISEILAPVYAPSFIDEFAAQLNLMISLYESVATIPNDWTSETLAQYKDQIDAAWEILYATEYKATQHRSLYLLASRWRANDDIFDILYEYYYNHEDENMQKRINTFKDLRLPGVLEELYQLILGAKDQILAINAGMQTDSTSFMYLYELAMAKKEEVLDSTDEMILDLYKTLEFDYLVTDSNGDYVLCSFEQLFYQFRRMTNGYLSRFKVYLGIDAYENLWDEYASVLTKITTMENYSKTDEYAQDIEMLLTNYLALSPKQQFAFLCLIHPFYEPTANTAPYPVYAWEDNGVTYRSQFAALIYDYYKSILPESTHEIFSGLMLASEALANSYLVDRGDFVLRMNAVYDAIDTVQEWYSDDWKAFNNVAEDILLNFEEIYNKLIAEDYNDPSLNDEKLSDKEKEDFGNLMYALADAYAIMVVYQNNPQQALLAFCAVWERVEYFSNIIVQSNDPRILRAYYYDVMFVSDVLFPDGSVTTFGGYTPDFFVWWFRQEYVKALTGASYMTAMTPMWDAYQSLGITDFLLYAADLYHDFVYMSLLQSTDPNHQYFPDGEYVMEVARWFRAMSTEQRHFLLTLDGSVRMYQSAVVQYGRERNAALGTIAQQLMQVEYMYTFYEMTPDAKYGTKTYAELLVSYYQTLMKTYGMLTDELKEEFHTYYGEIFEYYQEKCEGITIPEQPEEQA